MQTRGKTALGIVGALTVVVVVVWLITVSRNAQQNDFRGDLGAVGIAHTNPTWEDEADGSELEAAVKVLGCVVELERAKGEKRVVGKAKGRPIEAVQVDGVRWKNDELPTDDFGTAMVTMDALERYLREGGKKRFPCLQG